MSKRKATSKRLRFEVFKRDNFTCQYCSAKPPKVPLEIDHIVPVSKNGMTTIDNLVTACFDCNRGKSNVELNSIPESLSERMERRNLAQLQYAEYKKILKKEKMLINADILAVEEIYSSNFEDYVFTERFKITVKNFIKQLGVEETQEAMEKACLKIYRNENQALKYFCGICWNKIKEL
jgi:CRISPR/Cas system Type II protein with McrA/HNH and RuvC-like nuclease domain